MIKHKQGENEPEKMLYSSKNDQYFFATPPLLAPGCAIGCSENGQPIGGTVHCTLYEGLYTVERTVHCKKYCRL